MHMTSELRISWQYPLLTAFIFAATLLLPSAPALAQQGPPGLEPPGSSGMLSSTLPRAGERIFIEPLVVKDADIDNQITMMPQYMGGYHHSSAFQNLLTIEKRLWYNFSLQIGAQYDAVFTPHFTASGWEFEEVQSKYMFYENPTHEIFATWIERVLFSPQTSLVSRESYPAQLNSYFLFNKGFGDIPISFLRPFAIQSDGVWTQPFGNAPQPLAPYLGAANYDQALRFDFALEYSLLYLNDVVGHPVPSYLVHFTPAVEMRLLTNFAHNGYYGESAGYLSYELNYQAPSYQISFAYQRSFGPDAPFRGQSFLLYATYFYDDLLREWGFNPTPW
jgi:hypothetical protein